MLKGQKGITLVALVITIIVLLILAGVTISLVFDGGLFKLAEDAGGNYKDAAEQERTDINTATNTAEKYYFNVTH